MIQPQIKRCRAIAEINVVPYVDVMLVLLVVFMVTAPLMMQGVSVDLPNANANPLPIEQELPILVTVDSSGYLYLNIADNPDKQISPSDLASEVAAALILNPQRDILVRGDKSVSYNDVLQAMVLLQKSGVNKVGLETASNDVDK